jgi:nitrite reductase/ring-hydroxylating ferredoxin subunit
MLMQRVEVATLAELAETGRLCVTVAGLEVLLIRVGKRIVACQSRCPHRAARLEQGTLRGHHLTCAAHGWTFDLRSGWQVLDWWSRLGRGHRTPARLQEYPVHVDDGRIWIELPWPAAEADRPSDRLATRSAEDAADDEAGQGRPQPNHHHLQTTLPPVADQ